MVIYIEDKIKSQSWNWLLTTELLLIKSYRFLGGKKKKKRKCNTL